MKRIIGFLMLWVVAVLALVSCGGGGGGGGESPPPVTPPSQSLQGTYALTGFQVNYSDGTTFTELSPGITSWSGTMIIGTNTFSQSIVLNGIVVGTSGSISFSWITPNVSGIAHVTDSSGTYDVAFAISGMDFSTYSGVVPTDDPGITFEEWDHWTKVSDSLSPARESSVTDRPDEQVSTGKRWIGELLMP